MAARTAVPLGRLLPPEEAAARIGIKPDTLAHWRSQGRGPAFTKDGGYVAYAESDIDEWARAHRVVPAAP